MVLTLELSPELESQLQAAAARNGQDINTFATTVLAQASVGGSLENQYPGGQNRLSLTEFDNVLEQLAAIGDDIVDQDEQVTHSREDIYFDHD